MSTAESFYRRPLPPSLIALSSPEGRAIFKEALEEGGLEGYFPLAEQLHTQADPAFCGLGSLVVVLNALAIDPGRLWKGPWRWFGEDMLDCCSPLDRVRREGITLSRLACLARCNGARVRTYPADETTLAELRYYLRAASSAPSGMHLIAAYSRSALGQSGEGHYSPVGGYHRGRDMALMLDVARFKYPPHWVPIPLLWEAMQPKDAMTQRPRGYLVLTRAEGEGRAPLCCAAQEEGEGSGAGWREAWASFHSALSSPAAIATRASLEDELAAIARRFPRPAARIVEIFSPPPLSEDPARRREQLAALFEEIHRLPLCDAVRRAGFGSADGSPAGELLAELFVIALVAYPSSAPLPPSVAAEVAELRAPGALSPILSVEVARVRVQLEAIMEASGSIG